MKIGTIQMWRVVLLGLLLIDILILAYGICGWAGAGPGWLRVRWSRPAPEGEGHVTV
jgi:hypothetical protein